MKVNRYSFFMELVVALFFFSIISCIVASTYGKAYQLQQQSNITNQAVMLATNLLEDHLIHLDKQSSVYVVNKQGELDENGEWLVTMEKMEQDGVVSICLSLCHQESQRMYTWNTNVAWDGVYE